MGRFMGRIIIPRHSVCKGDRAKVGKWNKICNGGDCVILDDPLRVLTAKNNVGAQNLLHRVVVD